MPTPVHEEVIRPMTAADDAPVAALIRECLKAADLDRPGTVYFDAGLDHLSQFYAAEPKRHYFVATQMVAFSVGLALQSMTRLTVLLNCKSSMFTVICKAMALVSACCSMPWITLGKSGISRFILKLTIRLKLLFMFIMSLVSLIYRAHLSTRSIS